MHIWRFQHQRPSALPSTWALIALLLLVLTLPSSRCTPVTTSVRLHHLTFAYRTQMKAWYALAPVTKASCHLSPSLLEKQVVLTETLVSGCACWTGDYFKMLPKYSLFPTFRNICLFSYVKDNNLRQKGPLEVIWSKPLLEARPTVKLH